MQMQMVTIQKITQLILSSNLQSALQQIDKLLKQQMNTYFQIELRSLKGHVLTLQSKYQDALLQFNHILSLNPFHFLTLKRRGLIRQKINLFQQSLSDYKSCSYMDPQNRTIKSKIKKLGLKISQIKNGGCEQINEHEEIIEHEAGTNNGGVVRFGNNQVFQITTEQSDESFALINNQIKNLSEKKPKKSILKHTHFSSFLTQKKVKSEDGGEKQEVKDQCKIQQASIFLKNDQQSIKSSKKIYSIEKQLKKKKCKSVSHVTHNIHEQ